MDVKYSIRNGEAKELTFMTHGLRTMVGKFPEGMGDAGWVEGGKGGKIGTTVQA